MKLLRSITQRGFRVGTAGWFPVLRPNTWFPASRLPGRFRSPHLQQAPRTGAPVAPTIDLSRALALERSQSRPLRRAAILLLAAVLTAALLWWIIGAPF